MDNRKHPDQCDFCEGAILPWDAGTCHNPACPGKLTKEELALLKDARLCLHVSAVFHRPEYRSLREKGLIDLEDQGRVWYKPSYYVVRTEVGNRLLSYLRR